MEMDEQLQEAARNGDVEFLKEAFAVQPLEYFLAQSFEGSSFLHIALRRNKAEFMKEAMNILPTNMLKQLLLITDSDSYTLLHSVAYCTNISVIKCVTEMYASLSWDDDDHVKPWLALLTFNKMTPLNLALEVGTMDERYVIEMMLMDPQLVSCTIADKYGNTPLHFAIRHGFSLVAEKILMSPFLPNSIFGSEDSSSPFSHATHCSDNVARLLLKRCDSWLDTINNKGFSVLHQWVEEEKMQPLKLLLEGDDDFVDAKTKIFKELIFWKENEASNTPLHLAAKKKDSELGQILIRGYQQQISVDGSENQALVAAEYPPWEIKNNDGDTPLHTALCSTSRQEELALKILSINPTMRKICNNKGENPFFLAVRSGCEQVVEEIMRIEEPRFHMLRRNDGTTVIHSLFGCPEKTGRMLLMKYWWLINLRDDIGKTAFDYAKQENVLWLVNLLRNPSLIEAQKEDFDWMEACKREESDAVLAYVDNCQDLQRVCREQNDSPLHHIRLPTYRDYLNFLKNPSIAELKNTTDHDGATALHRALERKDMHFAKALLLDDGVERIIRDHAGTTAMDLLAKLCKGNDDWAKMCKQIKVNPYLRTTYIQPGTNLEQMRNTLSVIAALLATITFAAGFTLPGGINSDNGQALLGKKAAFLVFLLADVYAMCTSMFVLFCLVWSMVSVPDMARLLVDRSVFILMQSLYATLLAFMTGIYTVIEHSSLWAAIVIFVMCSFIAISANRTILHKMIAFIVPAANTEKQDRMRLLEEGHGGTSTAEKDIPGKTE